MIANASGESFLSCALLTRGAGPFCVWRPSLRCGVLSTPLASTHSMPVAPTTSATTGNVSRCCQVPHREEITPLLSFVDYGPFVSPLKPTDLFMFSYMHNIYRRIKETYSFKVVIKCFKIGLSSFMPICYCCLLFSRSVVPDPFLIPQTITRQAPLSMGFPRQDYWSGLPCPPPGDLPKPGIEPTSTAAPAL